MRGRQLDLALKQRSPKGRGGRRPGAGRPRVRIEDRDYVPHLPRPALKTRRPVHVTLKLADGLASLRRRDFFGALRKAVAVAREKGLEVVHFSVLDNHLHLLLEPTDVAAMARSIQSLAISFAKRLNLLLERKGAVFAERYHLRVLKSPTEVRNALAYVLSNESKHRGRGLGTYFISQFSSGHAFDDWKLLFGRRYDFKIATDWSLERMERWLSEILVPPRTWLLKEGWKKAGPVRQ